MNLKLSEIEQNKGQIPGLPKNPRIIKNDKYRKLVKSIEENPEMLEYRELLVYPYNGKYIIIGGNMRFKAMKELGYTEFPVKLINPEATVEQLKAYTIKDNAAFGEWDDVGIKEWDLTELDNWGIDIKDSWLNNENKKAEEDDFDEKIDEIKTVAKRGDIYQLGRHRLMCGDSTKKEDVEALMKSKQADLLVTDPPYNVDYTETNNKANMLASGKTFNNHRTIENDKMSNGAFYDFLNKVFSNAHDALKKGGVFYVWYSNSESINFINALKNNNLLYHQILMWYKNRPNLGFTDYQNIYEPCLYGWKEGAGHYFREVYNEKTVIQEGEEINVNKLTKDEMKDLLKKFLEPKEETDIIKEDRPLKADLHPTMKPVNLFSKLIKNSSKEDDIVLDLFGGSGTTIIAAEQLDRTAYVMEYDEHYADVIIARYEKYTGNKAVKLN